MRKGVERQLQINRDGHRQLDIHRHVPVVRKEGGQQHYPVTSTLHSDRSLVDQLPNIIYNKQPESEEASQQHLVPSPDRLLLPITDVIVIELRVNSPKFCARPRIAKHNATKWNYNRPTAAGSD